MKMPLAALATVLLLFSTSDASASLIPLQVVSAGAGTPGSVNTMGTSQHFVDGVNVATNGRGFNISVLDETDGSLIDATSFDTYAGDAVGSGPVMANYIDAIPDGRIVLVAVFDTAFQPGLPYNTQELSVIAALEGLGGPVLSSYGFRVPYGLIGTKGAAPGTGIFDVNFTRDAPVTVNGFLDTTIGKVVVVPEPTSLALLGLGGLVLCLKRRKRRRKPGA